MTIQPQPSNPSVTKAEILHGLRESGITPGAGVIVHSSLRSFGVVEGGAMSVIEALMEAVTEAGTLLMPSFNHAQVFRPGGPGIYDPTQTPTMNGAIPDLFWRLPGVHRSLNPTHAFAAWGKNAQRYTAGHHRTLTMGKDSPLGLLWQDGGFGLLLGVGYGANTFHHVVETTTRAPCLGYRTEAFPVRLPDGRVVEGRTWGWRNADCPFTDEVGYAQEMRRQGLETRTMIGSCQSVLFRLQGCYRVVAELFKNGTDRFPPCSRCPIRPRRTRRTQPTDWDAQLERLQPDSTAWTY